MSSLRDGEKRYLERILAMGGGLVLDYTDPTFGEFFRRHGVDIHGSRYTTHGTSKARKLRAFWEVEADALVGKVLNEMLDSYETGCELDKRPVDAPLLEKARSIAGRLCGVAPASKPAPTQDDFLLKEFSIPSVRKLPIEAAAIAIVEARLEEARISLRSGAHLSVIFMCGSVLEAVLLGAAQMQPASFNRASGSAKDADGRVKQFHEWTLSQLIDVASEVGLLKPDVKKFSHGLRDFRNYIHPYAQMTAKFSPDEHTAKLCFQVLKAALASVAGERS